MFWVLLVLLLPVNLLGLAALVARVRSRSAAWLVTLGILSLLGAATALLVGVFGAIETDRSTLAVIDAVDETRRGELEARGAEDKTAYVVTAFLGTALPWIAGMLCIARARRLDLDD